MRWECWQNYGRNGEFKESANCSRRASGGFAGLLLSRSISPEETFGTQHFLQYSLSIFKDVLIWSKLSAGWRDIKGTISWHWWPVPRETNISDTPPACFILKNLPNCYQCGFAPRERMQNKGTWENWLIRSSLLKVRINQGRKFLKVFFLFPIGFRQWEEN